MVCVLIGPVGVGLLLGILTRRVDRSRSMWKAALSSRLYYCDRLLTEVSATVFATEPCSRLADEAIAGGIPVIVTIAVIVCI
jgi:hypothetical protein